jgi:hypothetical protein
MRHSAIILALGLSTALSTTLAGNDRLLSYSYVTQQTCLGRLGFTPDFDVMNPPGLGGATITAP